MVREYLEPRLELLREEYVLVQAWKKTASYIRYHNWFSDTLALDRAAINLPAFIGGIRERLQSADHWQNKPLRIVPAPKSQRWRVRNGAWEPVEKRATAARLRPLAHVGLADQVVATALMLCLADRVETLQGDPRAPIYDELSRKQVISYGNRLFCDPTSSGLRHRWGSAKLYRAYYQDYRTFLSRPEAAADAITATNGRRVYVVHADLRQFYDRVRPVLLGSAIDRMRRADDDPAFFELAGHVLNWGWDTRDERDVRIYAQQAGLDDFARVALPQGLVAAGFFANVVLLSFDEALRRATGNEIASGVLLADASRYVDDLRLLITVEQSSDGSLSGLQASVCDWVHQLLNEEAPGLALSAEKTQIAAIGGDERPLVRQSAKMNRIQSAVSGGFDALGGEEIIDAVQGLMRAQDALSVREDSGWSLSPVPDVRDETVARFGASRYRATFRSIRPLLEDSDRSVESARAALDAPQQYGRIGATRTRRELDDDTRVFALGLIQRWVNDPSSVRLLRIGLDLWPDAEVLKELLGLLRPFTQADGRRKAPRRVAWYCLSEILRAGATETGLVPDSESLPSSVDVAAYRNLLRDEAVRLVGLPRSTIPWYLRQQALLFLAAFDPAAAPVVRAGTGPESRDYRELIRFLRGEGDRLLSADFATLAVLARRSFVDSARAIQLTQPGLNPARLQKLAHADPSLLLELDGPKADGLLFDSLSVRVREDLCRTPKGAEGGHSTLAQTVLSTHPGGSLRNELSILRFAKAFVEQWREQEHPPDVITPIQVQLKLVEKDGVADVEELYIHGSRADATGSLYEVPVWCESSARWRFQLGFLLRFALSGQVDFTRRARAAQWKEAELAYRPAESHWYQRLYGLYSGQPAFGDDWLPITDWLEGFLLALLRWPGCHAPQEFGWVEQAIEEAIRHIGRRITDIEQYRGNATRALILPLLAKRSVRATEARPLRACVVQTAIPAAEDFRQADLTVDQPDIRRRHRNHLSAALAAVERMLTLRKTHTGDGRLDWLILPELATHPDDVRTHLVPFARAHRAMILTGLTYQRLLADQPLVNSALWIIPEWSDAYGLQIRTRRQGKAHMAPTERAFDVDGTQLVQGFRPCQWLIGYPWCEAGSPVWLTAAICYDATDLGLAADLRNRSDVFAIPALNRDVGTFDQMALALHYHMFQLVIVANNGQYGGSNAYWPRSGPHVRQIFHTHGQPQASISFLEIDDIAGFLDRHNHAMPSQSRIATRPTPGWKFPPAGIGEG